MNPNNPSYRIAEVELRLKKTKKSLRFANKNASGVATLVPTLQKYFAEKDRENTIVITVNNGLIATGYHLVSIGTLSLSLVHPREVFKAAILMNAYGIVLAHNHFHSSKPSAEDEILTSRLKEAGAILGIPLLDSIIVCCGSLNGGSLNDKGASYYSFSEAGKL